MTLQGYLNKLKAADLAKIAESILIETEQDIIDYEQDQLYAGQDGKGNYLFPTYLDDPFFKTKKAAESYAKYKAGLSQRSTAYYLPAKPYAVPNLIITGRLVYDRLKLVVQGDKFSVAPTESATRSMLEKKYGSIFRLNPTVLGEYKRQVFNKRLMERIKKALK